MSSLKRMGQAKFVVVLTTGCLDVLDLVLDVNDVVYTEVGGGLQQLQRVGLGGR